MSKTEQEVEKLVTSPIENIGYEIYDVTYRKEGKSNYLTIFIDKKDGISIDDCEKVNNEITDLLDEKNIIKEPYYLEVSSPGLERVLKKDKHFQDSIGYEIYVKSFNKIKEVSQKEIEGILKSFNDDSIVIERDNKEIEIQRKDIALVKRVFRI